ncbi:IclR family transcriptional regulator [Microvirga puerhi]|uniref:IclR family transcriptional regulator n=1 Tax=Microvirga puerhi TaxID=2876078 RepID=A0ABS7VHC2_9HYPH|nr:IclR family transcriptional regulator [Microvirga puerhi]MBZ6074891.1 IclR family transcriptional regulator [Microvirga puerhi]
MRKDGQGYIVQPVMKALEVLDYVVKQGRDVTLTETVKELKLPKTTVFRYLQTLSAASFLDYDLRRDRYRAGPRFRRAAEIDRSLQKLREVVQPEMHDLSERFGETVNLAILAEKAIVYIDIVDRGRTPRTEARVGQRHPIHSTSLGKAIAAHLPDEELEALCMPLLPARTIHTLTDGRYLRRQVENIRHQGYAMDMSENEDGHMCIGVPILDDCGRPVAAMSLSAPEARLVPDRRLEAAEALKTSVDRVVAKIYGATQADRALLA